MLRQYSCLPVCPFLLFARHSPRSHRRKIRPIPHRNPCRMNWTVLHLSRLLQLISIYWYLLQKLLCYLLLRFFWDLIWNCHYRQWSPEQLRCRLILLLLPHRLQPDDRSRCLKKLSDHFLSAIENRFPNLHFQCTLLNAFLICSVPVPDLLIFHLRFLLLQ